MFSYYGNYAKSVSLFTGGLMIVLSFENFSSVCKTSHNYYFILLPKYFLLLIAAYITLLHFFTHSKGISLY